MATYTGPIVDVDVHNNPASESEIRAYMPKRWEGYSSINPAFSATASAVGFRTPVPPVRRTKGGPPGSSYDVLKEDLLDPYNYFRAVLTHNLGAYPDHHNQYFVRDVCRAANDWMIDTWLPRDDRLAAVMVVPQSLPEEAAAEVHRLGDHPQIVAVLIASNPLRRPIGDPIYHPIYKAAAEHGLSITTHVGIDHAATTAGGPATTLITSEGSATPGLAEHNISSCIVHGVFEKFPGLHVVIKEQGQGWLPSLVWRLDHEYDRLREESPWVKKWPSEYIREHIRLSTQPLEAGPRTGDLAEFLSSLEWVEDVLCFSSDFPHPSMDDHLFVARMLPQAWHRKIFCDNACSLYGWDPPVAPEPKLVDATA